MQKAIILIIIIGALTTAKCSRDALKIERQDYTGNNLRIDGVYYNKPKKGHFFLYRNGVFYDGGSRFNGSLDELKSFYSQKENYKKVHEIPYWWGVFIINNNEITIEKWISGDAFGRYKTTKYHGIIINDTTMLLNRPGGIIEPDTFYFHKISIKPDSTNIFIK